MYSSPYLYMSYRMGYRHFTTTRLGVKQLIACNDGKMCIYWQFSPRPHSNTFFSSWDLPCPLTRPHIPGLSISTPDSILPKSIITLAAMHHERDHFNKSGRRTAIDLPSSPATPCLDPPNVLLVSLLDNHTRRRPRAGGGGGGGMGHREAAGQRSRAPGKGGPSEIQVRVVFSPFRLMSPSSSSATAR
jgi:hypothetical protein